MISFIFKRFLQLILVMLVISVIAFSIQSYIGDPIDELVGQSTSAQEREALREQLGLKDPFFVQYGRFIRNALQGDFGNSYFFKRPTLEIILEKLPATVELVFLSSIIVISLSIPLGIYTAIHPKKALSKIIMGLSIIGISIPVFLTSILLLFVFSQTLKILPSFGRGEIVAINDWWQTNFLSVDGWAHIILPACALASIMLPLFIRLVRAEMLEALGQEYIRFAKAKGLNKQQIRYKHALRNTLLPVITIGGVQLGTMVAYTILTESVFQWPGMGFMFLEAIKRADIPLISTYIIFVGFIFVLINTVVDLIYGFIDPRVKLAGGK